jgi:hypothetical protein
LYTPYIVDDNTRGESLEFVISRSQVQIPSVAPLKNQAPMRVSRGCCFYARVKIMLVGCNVVSISLCGNREFG